MKFMFLGIAILLFSIALILSSSGAAATLGLGIAFCGLVVSGTGYLKSDKS